MAKGPDAFRTISEVAESLDLPQHVLRFWETRFTQIKPMKRGGGRRFYRPDDVALLAGIKHLLYGEGYTIRGVQRILKEQGARAVVEAGETPAPRQAAPHPVEPARLPPPPTRAALTPAVQAVPPAPNQPERAAPAAPEPVEPVDAAPPPQPAVVRRVKRLSDADAGRLRQVVADLADMKHLLDRTG